MKREVALQIRLTRGEYDILKARAGGNSLASYVRSLVCAPVQGKPYVFKTTTAEVPIRIPIPIEFRPAFTKPEEDVADAPVKEYITGIECQREGCFSENAKKRNNSAVVCDECYSKMRLGR